MIKKRFLSMLVLLMVAVTGAWAKTDYYNVTFDGFYNRYLNTTVTTTLPKTFTAGPTGHEFLPWQTVDDGDEFTSVTVTNNGSGMVSASMIDEYHMSITVSGAFVGNATIHVDLTCFTDPEEEEEEPEEYNASTTITVRCVLAYEAFDVTYDANGGSGAPSAQEKRKDTDLTLSTAVPTRAGYTFAGWNTAADGSGTSYDAGATYTANEDVTLYAQWTPVYNVTRDATMSEGWTIDPAGPVAEGVEVTATYSGSRHVKSVTYRPAGTIGGQFTVNASGDKVYFAKGNLQYIGSAATPYWKFADNQWDYLGTSTGQNSSATNVDRDLFGWGTKTDPYKTSDQSGTYSWNEWGENAITNGGNRINSGWRTLERTEWAYLWNSRDNAANLRTLATVNNVTGLILMPDGWTASGVALTVTTNDYTTNNINSADWNTLEQQGCVFLPAAGWRDGTSVAYLTTHLCYYSSTISGSDCAYRIAIAPNNIDVENVLYRRYGCSVRLVRPVVELSPNAEKTVWTLASMPPYDIELSAEYDPTYTATFADGSGGTGWDIDPASGVQGTTVTVSYTGENKVKSVTVQAKP